MLEEGKIYRLGTLHGKRVTICIEEIETDNDIEQVAWGWMGNRYSGFSRQRIAVNKETRKVKITTDDDD